MNILVTGGAGFIGSSLIDRLLLLGHGVIAIDNYDPFYDKSIKLENQVNHFNKKSFQFEELDINNINQLKIDNKIDCIVHLAAKAGVRPSILNPIAYFETNINGTLKMLEFAKTNNISQFVFASSSSVYGVNDNYPWSENDLNLQPISPYAASKLACEKIGYTYSQLYDIRFIALRFFTVFGPRQRPDLAISKFIKQVFDKQKTTLYGNGDTSRDYTYIDDIVDGIINSISYQQEKYSVINLGNNKTTSLRELLKKIEGLIGNTAIIENLPEQSGDVPHTCANIEKAVRTLSYHPKTSITEGLKKQIDDFMKNRAIK